MTDAITKAVEKHLSPEQAARYKKELVARTAARKRMAVDNLVVLVDQTLFLSAEQRRKLVDILGNNWDESWNQAEYFMNEERSFPPMPNEKILPLLTQPQRAVWKAIAKNNVESDILDLVVGDDLDEEIWPDDAPQKDEVLPPPREKATDGGGKK
jgi:hypothetical protein